MQLHDAHVVLTGGSKGIGAAIAREFCQRGARLSLIARESPALAASAAAVRGAAIPADLSDSDQTAGLIDRAEALNGAVDVLVNCAAIGLAGNLCDTTADDLAFVMRTNLIAPMELCRQVLPGMRGRGAGAIFNVSSLTGEIPMPHASCYGASKAGLTMFTMHLQQDTRDTNINVSAVVLGGVQGTDLHTTGLEDPVMADVARRFNKLANLTVEQVAARVADCIALDRRVIMTLPRTAAPVMAWRRAPYLATDRLIRPRRGRKS